MTTFHRTNVSKYGTFHGTLITTRQSNNTIIYKIFHELQEVWHFHFTLLKKINTTNIFKLTIMLIMFIQIYVCYTFWGSYYNKI